MNEPPSPDAEYRRKLRDYAVGFALAVALTGGAFALVLSRALSATWTRSAIVALALVQVVVHFRCFLHVGLRRSSRDELWLLLFSALIVGLMAGGTLMVLANLHTRMK